MGRDYSVIGGRNWADEVERAKAHIQRRDVLFTELTRVAKDNSEAMHLINQISREDLAIMSAIYELEMIGVQDKRERKANGDTS